MNTDKELYKIIKGAFIGELSPEKATRKVQSLLTEARQLQTLFEQAPDGSRLVKSDNQYYVANNIAGVTNINFDGDNPLEVFRDYVEHTKSLKAKTANESPN